MLNRALRLLEADVIVSMGFLIHDLHRQIEKLHREQVSQYDGQPFTVYRGQGLSASDFEKLKSSEGGLLSFNSFLSTGMDRHVSMDFAATSSKQSGTVGILFVMTIDPNITSIPFADITHVSYFESGSIEVLFAMNSVFRIDRIKGLNKDGKLFEVQLTLTTDEDPQLRLLGERVEEEIQGENDWERIGNLLIKLGQLDKAQELYIHLLEQASNEEERARCNHQLGCISSEQGDYRGALSHLETALDIRQKVFPANHPDLATSYKNLGSVYSMMGEYSKALSFFEKGLTMRQKTLPAKHPALAELHNDIGSVYSNIGDHQKALSYLEKGLAMCQKTLPENHPALATAHSSIGSVYSNMGDQQKALSYLEKGLDIRRKTLPANHSALATSYNDIGSVYSNIGDQQKALSYFEKGLDIRQKVFAANHPALATSYHAIGLVYGDMQEYSKALSYLEKGLDIRQKAFPTNHPHMATSYKDIGSVYLKMNDYPKALSYLERALDIRKCSLPPSHPAVVQVAELIKDVKKKL